jgi:hypothetical protein
MIAAASLPGSLVVRTRSCQRGNCRICVSNHSGCQMVLMLRNDVQDDRYCDRLLDPECELFFAEYVEGNGQEIAYMTWSAKSSL